MKPISSQYLENQIKTASQGKLIVMLYEGAIRHIDLALQRIPEKKYELIHEHIIKAQDIITELTLALDLTQGEIAQKLYNLYMYSNKKLVEANIKKEAAPLEEIRKYLSTLKKTWEQVAQTQSTKSNPLNESQGTINIKS